MWKEFKAFALKGNVLDLAVAVVIGAAFGKIVSSLVSDIITPLIGLLTGGIDLKDRVLPCPEGLIHILLIFKIFLHQNYHLHHRNASVYIIFTYNL